MRRSSGASARNPKGEWWTVGVCPRRSCRLFDRLCRPEMGRPRGVGGLPSQPSSLSDVAQSCTAAAFTDATERVAVVSLPHAAVSSRDRSVSWVVHRAGFQGAVASLIEPISVTFWLRPGPPPGHARRRSGLFPTLGLSAPCGRWAREGSSSPSTKLPFRSPMDSRGRCRQYGPLKPPLPSHRLLGGRSDQP